MPKVHRYDQREHATEVPTVHSAQTNRTQYTHRTWLSSYLNLLNVDGLTVRVAGA